MTQLAWTSLAKCSLTEFSHPNQAVAGERAAPSSVTHEVAFGVGRLTSPPPPPPPPPATSRFVTLVRLLNNNILLFCVFFILFPKMRENDIVVI